MVLGAVPCIVTFAVGVVLVAAALRGVDVADVTSARAGQALRLRYHIPGSRPARPLSPRVVLGAPMYPDIRRRGAGAAMYRFEMSCVQPFQRRETA